MKGKRVTPWFASRFLIKYLMTRTYSAADSHRIAKAADAGSIIARPVDWLMMKLSISYVYEHSFRRGLEHSMADGKQIAVDAILKQREEGQ